MKRMNMNHIELPELVINVAEKLDAKEVIIDWLYGEFYIRARVPFDERGRRQVEAWWFEPSAVDGNADTEGLDDADGWVVGYDQIYEIAPIIGEWDYWLSLSPLETYGDGDGVYALVPVKIYYVVGDDETIEFSLRMV